MTRKLLGIILLVLSGAVLGSIDYSTKYFIKYLEPSIDSREEILNYLTSQFDPFRKDGINMRDIEAIYNLPKERKKELEICRFQIVNKVIYGQSTLSTVHSSASNIYRVLGVALQRIVKRHNIENVDFLVLGVDSIDEALGIEHLIIDSPTFMMSKDLSSNLERKRLLFPDPYILTEKNWPKLIKEVIEGSEKHPWHEKDSTKIFWRGATTGKVYNLENYDKIPRLTLAMLSRSFPELIDAQFTCYTNFSENDTGFELFRILTTLLDNSGHLTESEHLKYKYLISVDGNTCAWARVPWIMLSNSVLLKQETEFMQFFYPAMKPYVHYVPLKNDLSDIFEKLSWLKDNDKKAIEISRNATKFVQDNLMLEDLDEYVAIILKEYHKLQNFKIIKPTLPLFMEVEY